jgi:hypothetical protein
MSVFVNYRKRVVREAMKTDEEKPQVADQVEEKKQDNMEVDEVVLDQNSHEIDVDFSAEVMDEMQKQAESYATDVEKGLFDKKKEFDKAKGSFQASGTYRQVETRICLQPAMSQVVLTIHLLFVKQVPSSAYLWCTREGFETRSRRRILYGYD